MNSQMTDDLARHLLRTAFRTSRELDDVLSLLRRHLPEGEYRGYAVAIASAVHTINKALLDKPLADKPALRAEIEESLALYDRFL